MHTFRGLATALAATLIGCSGHAEPVGKDGMSFAGAYHRVEPASGDMRVSRSGALWRVEIAAGSPWRGMATASDCFVVAEGTITDGKFDGAAVPFENDFMSVSADDLVERPGTLRIQFDRTSAHVLGGTGDGCGVGADYSGVYRLIPEP